MAAINPPSFMQNRTDHTASGDRLLLNSLVGTSGVVGLGTALKVTAQATPNMTVAVSAGYCFIKGTQATYQGTYHCVNDASVNLAVTASNASLPRRDLVVAMVEDAFYAGTVNAWSLSVVAGTPAASPIAPAAPANSLILAELYVGAAVTSITNANITDKRTPAASSIQDAPLVVTSTTRPATGILGQQIFESDTGKIIYWDGTAWVTSSYVSNANGQYYRTADGIQYAWINTSRTDVSLANAYTTLYQGTWDWTFPAPFIAPPAVSCSKFLWGTSASWGSVSTVTSTMATLRGIDGASRAAGTAVAINAIAIGKWK